MECLVTGQVTRLSSEPIKIMVCTVQSAHRSEFHSMQARKYTSEVPTQVLKLRADVTRSLKQWYQWPRKKDLCPQFKKKKNNVDTT